jgi:hypothetical protein
VEFYYCVKKISAGKKLSEVQKLTGIQSPQQLRQYFKVNKDGKQEKE